MDDGPRPPGRKHSGSCRAITPRQLQALLGSWVIAPCRVALTGESESSAKRRAGRHTEGYHRDDLNGPQRLADPVEPGDERDDDCDARDDELARCRSWVDSDHE